MQKIRKGIIPVAGFGTRFLPATKVFPKPMLPIIDKPVLQYIVEEFVTSGIEQIILVMNTENNLMRQHFETSKELEDHLEKFGKFEALEEVRAISRLADFKFVAQNGPYGNGTPILNCEKLIDDEPFAIAFGDDIIKSEIPVLKQMIEVAMEYDGQVVATNEVSPKDTYKYGILDVEKITDKAYKLNRLVEKPKVEEAPSNLAVTGRYILTPDIFDLLKSIKLDPGKELYLTDAIALTIAKNNNFYACKYDGTYYDCGNKLEFLKAINAYALEREDLRDDYKIYLKSLNL